MPRRDTEFAIRTQGLGALNRSLGRISKDLKRESIKHLRETAREVRDTAKPLAPVKTGKLAGSFRYQASARGASVSSALPQAGVHEFGGVISPRGVPITIARSRMLGTAVQREAPRIEEEIGKLLDRIARTQGFS